MPSPAEVEACGRWMRFELELLRPALVIPVGRLAIERFPPPAPLAGVIGRKHRVEKWGVTFDLIPLPHPSGASTWFKLEPGRTLTAKALRLLGRHPAWRELRR